MEKPVSLREVIQAALPELADAPDRLRIYVDGGEVVGNIGTLSHKVRYTLNIFVQELAKDPRYLNIIIINWLQQYQPDVLEPREKREQRPFIFEAEPIESGVWDIMIELKLTEHVIVRQDDRGHLHFKTIAEPNNTDATLGHLAPLLGVADDKQIGG